MFHYVHQVVINFVWHVNSINPVIRYFVNVKMLIVATLKQIHTVYGLWYSYNYLYFFFATNLIILFIGQ